MARTRILLYGATGRMGRAIRTALRDVPDLELTACVARRCEDNAEARLVPCPWLTPEELFANGEGLDPESVVIDVSLAPGTARLVEWLERSPRPLVSATTGLGERDEARIRALASRAPVLRASNLSVGNAIVSRMLQAIPIGAKALFDSDVIEHHHVAKRDAPSGTALLWASLLGDESLADPTQPRKPGDVRIHSVRSGTAVGTHRAVLAGAGETIEIVHTVSDRAVFALGALRAARFLHGKPPGLYSLEQTLEAR
jgi:4-hydroxy-tetrahydrodipicolinate reductase